MEETEQNLIDFYTLAGSVEGCTLHILPHFRVVHTTPGRWPSMVFGPDRNLSPETLLPGISEWMAIHPEVRFLAAGSDYLNRSHSLLLRETGFVPVDQWEMMELALPEGIESSPGSQPENVRVLETAGDLRRFSEIVNGALLGNQPVEPSLLHRLLNSGHTCFLGATAGKELVSVLLLYINARTAGFYLVATLQEEQGKGYGTRLVAAALQRLQREGLRKAVLHAARRAVPFYLKAGFRRKGQITLFYKT